MSSRSRPNRPLVACLSLAILALTTNTALAQGRPNAPLPGPAREEIGGLAQVPEIEVDSQVVLPVEPDDRNSWTVLPFVFYSPETELAGGLGLVHCFCLACSPTTRTSDIRAAVTYTQNAQLAVYLEPELYFQDNQYHLAASLRYRDFPETFNGIGNRTPDSLEEHFNTEMFLARVEFETLVLPSLYAGGSLELEASSIDPLSTGGLLDTGAVNGDRGGIVSGLGLMLTYDDRDSSYFPTTGSYARFSIRQYHPAFGSDYSFTRMDLDARQYLPLFGEHVLALNALFDASFGDTPFYWLAQLGGSDQMRGYYSGRFRDDHMAVVQAEYRMPLFWRFGLNLFVGVGDVFGSFSDLDFDDLKVAGGAGLRFAITDEHLNVRLDYGLGPNTDGIYFTVGEAF